MWLISIPLKVYVLVDSIELASAERTFGKHSKSKDWLVPIFMSTWGQGVLMRTCAELEHKEREEEFKKALKTYV